MNQMRRLFRSAPVRSFELSPKGFMRALPASLLLLLLPGLGRGFTDANPLRNLEVGGKAFPFSLPDAQGRMHGLDAYKGKPVVLCYHRPGQGFSEKTLAALSSAHKKFAPLGVVFLAVYHPDEEVPAQRVALPFPELKDEKMDFYGSYGLFILPTTIVLDKEHTLKAFFSSYQQGMEEGLEEALNGILGLKTAAKAPRFGLADKPQDPAVNLARKLSEDGKYEEALGVLEAALKAPAVSCEARLLAAEALLRLARPTEARVRAEECLKVEPGSPHAALLLGRSLALLGETAPAEDWLKKAAALNPASQRARYYLGELYEKTGRKDQALAEYRGALERVFK